jgi:hypothetical protein
LPDPGRARLARSKVGLDLTNSACWILLYLLRCFDGRGFWTIPTQD